MAIVCGFDLSVHSRPAVRAAAAIAARLGEQQLWVAHVLPSASREALEAAELTTFEAETAERLKQEVQELCEGFELPQVKTSLLAGPAAEMLADLAKSEQASLLVVASQGHGASPLYRLGGTSERVVVVSQVPVLVVRDDTPFVSWARNQRPLRITAGLDFTLSSDAAVRVVKMLRRAGPCDVTFAHVHYWYEAAARYGLTPFARRPAPDVEAQIDALLVRDLTARVGELGGEGRLTFLPTPGLGRLGDHLLEVAAAEKADLIVVGTHRRSGARRLTSVSGVVLHFGHASVACAPPVEVASSEARWIRRVLIPTDLSSFASHAIPHAYGLLAERGGEVHLLHIVTPDAARPAALDHDAEVIRQLRALVPAWAAEHGIVTRTEVVHRSDVARGINKVAARVMADAICIASHGRSGLLRAVLGSIADQVIRESQVPVLVVRPPAP